MNHASEAIEFEQVSAAYVRCRRCGKLVLNRLSARHNCHAFEIKHEGMSAPVGLVGGWVMEVNDGIESDTRLG